MLIAPFEGDWKDPAATEARLIAWEQAEGLSLPQDYRRFMIRFDGGYTYPNMFDSAIIRAGIVPSNDTFMFVDYFNDLALVAQHWRHEIYGAGTPPGMLIIGENPGGTQILLSLRPQDRGTICLWYHSTNIWGTDGNDDSALIRQADSFTAFLASLFDSPDKQGYDHWHTPRKAAKAREFDPAL